MGAIAERLAEYGPVGVLAIIVSVIAYLMWKMDKKVDINGNHIKELKKENGNTMDICKARKSNFGEIFDRIEDLENNKVKVTGEFKVINTELKNINKSIDSIQTGVNTILTHFAEKGMDRI